MLVGGGWGSVVSPCPWNDPILHLQENNVNTFSPKSQNFLWKIESHDGNKKGRFPGLDAWASHDLSPVIPRATYSTHTTIASANSIPPTLESYRLIKLIASSTVMSSSRTLSSRALRFSSRSVFRASVSRSRAACAASGDGSC